MPDRPFLHRDALRPAAARALTLQALHNSKRARRELLIVVPLLVGRARRSTPTGGAGSAGLRHADQDRGRGRPRLLGWQLARDLGRSLGPLLHRRMDPATAGTVAFLIRLALVLGQLLAVLRVLGIGPQTLAVGGAVFAVVFGLAAQQTLGNVIAGLVLISAQPFRVGDRVRLQAGGVAGQIEGVVVSHGLLYTTFAQGEDSIMVPNNVVLSAAVVPIREPAGVDLRARLRPDVKPTDVQTVIQRFVRTPMRAEPQIDLEEVDADEVVVRIAATPESEVDGPRLADEILAAIALAGPGGVHRGARDRARGRRRARAPRLSASGRPAGASRVSASRADPGTWRPRCGGSRAAAGARASAPARFPRARRPAARRPARRRPRPSRSRSPAGPPRRRPPASWSPRRRGSSTPASSNMPAPEMKPGNSVETPTPVPCRSARRPSANPRRPNFVAE